jgi:hypothetical protein
MVYRDRTGSCRGEFHCEILVQRTTGLIYNSQKLLAQWVDPIVEALDLPEVEDEAREVQLTRPQTPAVEKSRVVEVCTVIAYVECVLILN